MQMETGSCRNRNDIGSVKTGFTFQNGGVAWNHFIG